MCVYSVLSAIDANNAVDGSEKGLGRTKKFQSLATNVGGAVPLDREALLQRKRQERIKRRRSLFQRGDGRYAVVVLLLEWPFD